MAEGSEEMGKGMVEGLIEALSDKHSQMDLRFQHLAVSLAGTRFQLEISGTISLAVHMRDMTDSEREAHVQHTLEAIKA
jgi:hypothetical protein